MQTQFSHDFVETTVDLLYMKESGHFWGWDRDGDPTFDVHTDPDSLNNWIVNELRADLADTEVDGAKKVFVHLPHVTLMALIYSRWS